MTTRTGASTQTRKGFWRYADPEEALTSYHFRLELGEDGIEQELDAGVFLHNAKGIFALALADIFQYEVELAFTEPAPDKETPNDPNSCVNHLVHTYCKRRVNGVDYYIDVRGVTDNWKAFSNWGVDGRICLAYEDYNDLRGVSTTLKDFDAYYHAAMSVILRSRDAYAV